MKQYLLNAIEDYDVMDFIIFIDERCEKFWWATAGTYVHLASDLGEGYTAYLDADHIASFDLRPQGVGSVGVTWKNRDLMNPFDEEDLIAAVERFAQAQK